MNALKAHSALFILNVMYGINYLVAKGLMPDVIGPNGFILIRVGGATLLFWLIFIFRFQKVSKQDIGLLALCGLFGVAVNQLFFFNGLSRTSPVDASVIMVTTPIIVMIMAVVFKKEKFRIEQMLGVIIGAIAAVVFTLNQTSNSTATLLGDVFIFLNAFSYAIYLILVKPLMTKYSALTVITYVFTFGLLFVSVWPFSSYEFSVLSFDSMNSTDVLKIIFVVVGVTFLPYLLTVYAMKYVSATVTSIYIYLQPILAGLFVFLFALFGAGDYTNDFTLIKLICTVVIFLAVYLVIKPASKN